MIVGVVDIGTNSMRLLVVDDGRERLRQIEVTALGSGVDTTGHFDAERVLATLDVLERYGQIMDRLGVSRRRAVATPATRDAEDSDEFLERAARVLGIAPEVISGRQEAGLSYLGATSSLGDRRPTVVIDIGGGSTDFVYGNGTEISVTSVDLGSIRLTERYLPSRPTPTADLANARSAAAEAFRLPSVAGTSERAIGVAGSFTSLAAIALDLPAYDRESAHGSVLTAVAIRDMIGRISSTTISETSAIPPLDPERAPVTLAGAVLAEAALETIGFDAIAVSEQDLLDGLAIEVVRGL
jgi:exopolyphosphatase/guanosine-5'-triphosphate,3'-diphosphate pyrophosphatase